ncbi:hypothetical protein BN8_06583 [Fibrisoma limi BUZ 3]|uniref:FHA domain-containing protein n=1 Tax=Fibrisoma limi BUZ 3 TaxID=1185876 RepID=I2GTE8_9BACT|nr:FHA domain-containing protein [Fibrisoma limi]CCH57177.1 hypothetical protein BN8_06583 [Fibrisoma limi BUZ 3]
MSFIDTLKTLFGLTPSRVDQPTDQPNDTEGTLPSPKPAPSGLPPAAQRRDQVVRFIVDKLRPYQNEPGAAPVGLRLCIACSSPEEEESYRVALRTNQPGKFQTELNRHLADNYISLSKNWRFESEFYQGELPDCTYREGNLGLIVLDGSKPDGPPQLARLVTVAGQTEQTEYLLDPTQQTTFCIGRGRTTQTSSGRVRTNDIVILNDNDPGFDPEKGAGNGAVSRAHATIRYNMAQRQYALLVDAGGLPASGNKTKIFHPDDRMERADIAGMSYPLQHGDQIELGGSVTLHFELR